MPRRHLTRDQQAEAGKRAVEAMRAEVETAKGMGELASTGIGVIGAGTLAAAPAIGVLGAGYKHLVDDGGLPTYSEAAEIASRTQTDAGAFDIAKTWGLEALGRVGTAFEKGILDVDAVTAGGATTAFDAVEEASGKARAAGWSPADVFAMDLVAPGPPASIAIAPLIKTGRKITKLADDVIPERVIAQRAADRKRSDVLAHSQPTEEAAEYMGVRRAMTHEEMRAMTPDEALAYARSGAAIKRNAKSGQYIGAPRGMDTPNKVIAARKTYDRLVEEGLEGGNWYAEAQKGVERITNREPAQMQRVARELADTSTQAHPRENLGFMVRGHNAVEIGKPMGVVHTGRQARNFKLEGEGIPLETGPKTEPYRQAFDPTEGAPTTGTNDIHQGRALGYVNPDGTPWNQGFSPSQHAWSDVETVLAVERANSVGLGGRTDWSAPEIQAMAWVRMKGGQIAEQKGVSLAEGMKEAGETYVDFFRRQTYYSTHDPTPGRVTGHRTDMIDADESAKADWAQGRTWEDEHGRDLFLEEAGFELQLEQIPAQGSFTPLGGGPTEYGDIAVSRTLVGIEAQKGARPRGMDANQKQAMQFVEEVRGAFDAQEAVAGHFTMQEAGTFRKGDLTGWELEHGAPLTAEQMKALESGVAPLGYGGDAGIVVNRGSETILHAFDMEIKQSHAIAIAKALEESGVPIEKMVRARHDVIYTNMADKWAAEGPEVTEYLLEQAAKNPHVAHRIETSEKIRAELLSRVDRDAKQLIDAGVPESHVSEAVQNLRRVFAEGGWQGLRDAIKEGVVLPSIALPAIGLATARALEEEGPST